jgi:hypothetical protein
MPAPFEAQSKYGIVSCPSGGPFTKISEQPVNDSESGKQSRDSARRDMPPAYRSPASLGTPAHFYLTAVTIATWYAP